MTKNFEKLRYFTIIINIVMVIVNGLFLDNAYRIVKILAILICLLFCAALFELKATNAITIKSIFLCSIALGTLCIIVIVCDYFCILHKLTDIEEIRQTIIKSGKLGIAIYLLFTILQVIAVPIPSTLMILLGVAIYGPLNAFILFTIGTYIGSFIAYAMGKLLGRKAIIWLIGEDNVNRYATISGTRGKWAFVVMLLLPFFPDDVLCMTAGLSDMHFGFYALAVIFARPAMIAFTSYAGSGQIIPFEGWGVVVWIAIGVIILAAFISLLVIKSKKNKRVGQNNICTDSNF